MILFCLVLKVTLSVSKVISLIRSTSYPSLGHLIAWPVLRSLMQQGLEGYSWNSGFDPKNKARFVKTQNFRNLSMGTEFGRYSGGGIGQIMAWDARSTGKENGIRHKNDARLS